MRLPDGLVRITLKKANADGTVAVDMDPLSVLPGGERPAPALPHREVRRRPRAREPVEGTDRARAHRPSTQPRRPTSPPHPGVWEDTLRGRSRDLKRPTRKKLRIAFWAILVLGPFALYVSDYVYRRPQSRNGITS